MLIDDIEPRLPELGRLRMGEKGKKGEPVKLSQWRLTSHDEIVLHELAALYGGTPRPWTAAPEEGQFELYTETSALDVLIPPDPMTAAFESWGSGGCKRRCNGLDAVIAKTETVKNAKGEKEQVTSLVDEPCWCKPLGLIPGDEDDVKKGACDLVVRLNVVLPNVSGLGVWRLDTGSVFAYRELRGQTELLRRMAGSMLDIPAQLAIEQRRIKKPGQAPKEFIVPVLRMRRTLHELVAAAREGSAGELVSGGEVREIESGARRNTIADKPDHVQELIRACGTARLTEEQRHRLVEVVSNGRVSSSRDVTLAEASEAIAAIDAGRWKDLVGIVDPSDVTSQTPPAERTPRKAGSSAAVQLTEDEQRELHRLRTTLTNLPDDLRARADAAIAAARIPDELAAITTEHLATLGALIEDLEVEDLERTPKVGQVADSDTPWGKTEWDAAARAVGFTGARLLKEARSFATDLGIDPPRSLEEITNDSLVSRCHAWLREQGAHEGSAA